MNVDRIARVAPAVPTGTSTEGRHATPTPHGGHDSRRGQLFRAALSKSIATETRRRQARRRR